MLGPVAIAVLASAAVASWLATAWLSRRAPRDAATDEAHKREQAPIPLVGGLLALSAMAILAIGIGAANAFTSDSALLRGLVQGLALPPAIALGLLCSTGVGLLDDLRKRQGFPWQVKLAGQALAASAVFIVPSEALPCHAASAFLLLLVLQNAWNFFDNTDACVLAVASSALSVAIFASGDGASPLALVVLAICLGCLPHNWPQARVYLGDGGAHAIAYTLGWFGLTHSSGPLVASLGLHAVVLLDLVQVLLVRLAIGWPPWRGDRRHLAHRMARALSPQGVAWTMAAVSFASAVLLFGVF